MYLRYWRSVPNWGDSISPYIFEKLSGQRPAALNSRGSSPGKDPVYLATGSILSWCCPKAEIWGTGFMRPNAKRVRAPRKVHAVRGPLTRELLRGMDIECPEVYGDPAVIFPTIYNPKGIQKWFDVGVIPHYVDKQHPWVRSVKGRTDVRVIDIMRDVEGFVKDLLSCKLIISSSLHGLIAADAYGIPSIRVILSGRIGGGNFKYDDYYASLGCDHKVIRAAPNTPIETIMDMAELHTPSLDMRRRLLAACPFNKLGVEATV